MSCKDCGRPLPEGSRFCNYCGSQAAGPAVGTLETAADRVGASYQLDVDERVIFTLRPTMIFVLIRYIVAALVVVAAAALMGVLNSRNPQTVNGLIAFWVILGFGLLVFINPIYHHIQRLREVYTLTDHKLEMRYGLIAKTVRNIPLRNIQDVTVTASVWQRLLNLGDIGIVSASESGKIVLDDIHHPTRYTNLILAELRRRN
ncbi:MAG TPA: PH domain-containing protein [Blastocatellia bacterium]|nr:PH domain-containing protein [Blastocatellia bacterium]